MKLSKIISAAIVCSVTTLFSLNASFATECPFKDQKNFQDPKFNFNALANLKKEGLKFEDIWNIYLTVPQGSSERLQKANLSISYVREQGSLQPTDGIHSCIYELKEESNDSIESFGGYGQIYFVTLYEYLSQ